MKTLHNVLDDVPNLSKGMRDKLKGTETPFEHCVGNVATNHFIEAWADVAKDMIFMGNKDEAVYGKSILMKADINDACLKEHAAFAQALSQGHSSKQLVKHMNDLKALISTGNDLVDGTPDVEQEVAAFSKYMLKDAGKLAPPSLPGFFQR